ncbi:hypothetical protein [Flavobacterium taihuense]|uniref:Uncharacterized protein n=1 Tax=Flavobacterium taihuense TaxID=2857508 RepID=A0ABS6Y1F4_9FLAO|nr:hypothetical protein [Flavobacterium taihuense]MBW4362751.1 hypothetical protein [Flavobacterium taihuense]
MSQLPPTSWHYSGFGVKLSLFFGFAKSSKYKTIFPLSQLPKSVVVAVRVCSLTIAEHERIVIPIIDSNCGSFSAFRFPFQLVSAFWRQRLKKR